MRRKRNDLMMIPPPCDGRCSCRTFLMEWANRLSDEETVWSLEDLDGIDDMVFANLCCVVCRCTDREFRDFARSQLQDAHWDRQRERERLNLQ